MVLYLYMVGAGEWCDTICSGGSGGGGGGSGGGGGGGGLGAAAGSC